MASLVSRKFNNRFLTFSSSFCSQSLPSRAITKPSSQFHLPLASSPFFTSSQENPKSQNAFQNHKKLPSEKPRVLEPPIRFFSSEGCSSTNESREVVEETLKNAYRLRNSLEVLFAVQMGFFTWTCRLANTTPFPVLFQRLLATASPLALAYMVRPWLKLMEDLKREEGVIVSGTSEIALLMSYASFMMGAVQVGLGIWITCVTAPPSTTSLLEVTTVQRILAMELRQILTAHLV